MTYNNQSILQVNNLTKTFKDERNKSFTALDDVSFCVNKGDILGILGESGSGKSTLAKIIAGILQPKSGKVIYDSREITYLSKGQFKPFRKEIQYIFQNSFASINPKVKFKRLLREPLDRWFPNMSSHEKEEEIYKMISLCGLPENILDKYSREVSGGQLQRLSIARSLLVKPTVLIADEIVSALDIPIQNRILELIYSLKKEYDLTIILISHDISVIKKYSDNIIIMKDGNIDCMGTSHNIDEKSEFAKALSQAPYILKKP